MYCPTVGQLLRSTTLQMVRLASRLPRSPLTERSPGRTSRRMATPTRKVSIPEIASIRGHGGCSQRRHLAGYQDLGNENLRYARRYYLSGEWENGVADDNSTHQPVGDVCVDRLDASGNPVVTTMVGCELRVAHWNGSASMEKWSTRALRQMWPKAKTRSKPMSACFRSSMASSTSRTTTR